MNWLTNYVKPKISSVLEKRDTPENLWHKCSQCGHLIFQREFADNFYVCTNCQHHSRIGPDERLPMLYDNGEYDLIEVARQQDDPLKFRDEKKYVDRLKDARAKTGQVDALTVARGLMGGLRVVTAVQNFAFMAGSMGLGVGAGLLAAAEAAVETRSGLVVFTAAGGARMQEGILSLMQMPRSTVAVDMVKEAGLPYVVVLTDPTTGGVTASFAMLGDIQIAEPGALIGFAGPRVIENTIREKLPEGFQRAEYLLEHGMVDLVVPRADLRETLIRVFGLLTGGRTGTQEPKKPRKKAG